METQNTQNTQTRQETTPLLLLEIGTEEIPARFLPEAMARIKESADKLLTEYRIPHRAIKTYATPRRLSLIAEVEALQEGSEKEVWGPPVAVAFDAEGNPTRAAEAFAQTNGVSIQDLNRKQKGKGAYLVAVVKEEAGNTEEILPEVIQKLILTLNFPKSMRWGNSNLRFARPIHWVLATYANKKISFEIEAIKSGTSTRGHRFLSPAIFEIKDTRTYVNLMRNNFVILDPEERSRMILEGSRKLAASVNARLVEDEGLLAHVAYLVEYPVPVLGSFSPDYLSLPRELLITVMRGHQKYFALEGDRGNLVNYFVIVSNTRTENGETIKKGAEKVIRARFEDARFYYDEDKKVSLKERLEGLKKVIHHEKLGTVHNKILRICSLAAFIAGRCHPNKAQDIETVALLCKSDLISGVVREFPELQGIMGGYYADNEGLSREVSKGITEHYLPAFSGDRIPESDSGAVVSLADKLDNIAAFFSIGLTPTGTEDPFALRRQALGVISILQEKGYDLTLAELLEKALLPFSSDDKDALLNNTLKFFEQRMEPLFLSGGYPLDAVLSVIGAASRTPLSAIKGKLEATMRFKEDALYEPFLLAIKRVNNISAKGGSGSVSPSLFQEEEETLLHKEMETLRPEIISLLGEGKYHEAIMLLTALKDPINAFFDKVLVMDKNEAIKENRLAIRSALSAAFQSSIVAKRGHMVPTLYPFILDAKVEVDFSMYYVPRTTYSLLINTPPSGNTLRSTPSPAAVGCTVAVGAAPEQALSRVTRITHKNK
ncbi:MAG: glycine--tRNA ligase subunit beta, partial [Nitrospirales bacterium]|nr:glycine--tRNA ligase subunit beta [Nitrospirales bacterium]